MAKDVRFNIKATDKTAAAFRSVRKHLNSTTKLVAGLTAGLGAVTAWQGAKLASDFVRVGSSFDKMKISLDTITKGEGEEWFKKLNEWALKMPINTKKAIQAFTQMRAMGLKPSIADMTTLVDATSALGGNEDTLLGISRALGQIKTKGRVSTEELLQLAERGVPAFEILRQKMGLTSEQLGDIGRQGLDAQETITALIAGMQEQFGGQSEKIQDKWAGLTEALKSYWTEFQRLVMEAGVMEFLETKLKTIMDHITQMYQSGELQKWAQEVAEYFVNLGNQMADWVNSIENWQGKIRTFIQALETMAQAVIMIGKAVKATSQFLGKHTGRAVTELEARTTGDYSKMGVSAKQEAATQTKWEKVLEARGGDLSVAGAGTRWDEGGAGEGGEIVSEQSGTGMSGLPRTGLFKGHQGEIVLNPAQSNAMRAGGGGVNVTISPTFMSGDSTAARVVASEIQSALKDLNKRWG